jgi:hypothetical protein
MEPQDLTVTLYRLSHGLHSTYTREQHWTWVAGVLAVVACEKNHMDNIVYARLRARIQELENSV